MAALLIVMLCHRVTDELPGPHRKPDSGMESVCSSPTHFAELMAKRKAVFIDNHLSSEGAMFQRVERDKASSTRDRSNAGTLGVTEGRSLFAPLKKADFNCLLPTEAFPFGACRN